MTLQKYIAAAKAMQSAREYSAEWWTALKQIQDLSSLDVAALMIEADSLLNQQWLPIAEAPKDGTPVLVANKERGGPWVAHFEPVYTSGYRPENPWSSLMLNMRWHNTPYASSVPTHFMPLPGAPK